MNQASITLKYWLLGKLSSLMVRRSERDALAGLTTFCCFVGHGRSGSTLVGHLLNAHPQAVVANEIHSFRLLRRGLTESQLCRLILMVSRRQVRRGSVGGGGYTYSVPGQWQGRYSDLKVIGDRKAGATAREIFEVPGILELVDRKISLEIRFIHVMRHPLDAITTSFKKTRRNKGESANDHLRREIQLFFRRCRSVQEVQETFGRDKLHIVQHEQLVKDPAVELASLCRFLGLPAEESYLSACASIVMTKPHQTRSTIDWPRELLASVEDSMAGYPWLAPYLRSS